MATNNNTPNDNEEINASRNDTAAYGDDTLGENTGDSALAIENAQQESIKQSSEKSKEFDPRIETVIPDNDN